MSIFNYRTVTVPVPSLKKMIGLRWFEREKKSRRWEARFKWGQVTGGVGFSAGLCLFEEYYSLHLHLIWPNIFIRLGFLQRWHREPEDMMEKWGFSFFEDSIHLNWGRRTKIVHLPWEWQVQRQSYLLADQTWAHERRGEYGKFKSGHERYEHFRKIREQSWRVTLPYTYTLRSGEIQHRQATISVREWDVRRKWTRWTRFGARITRDIDVSFSDEVGERTGSWKGGTIGCSYAINPGETPEQSLRRMERERKF